MSFFVGKGRIGEGRDERLGRPVDAEGAVAQAQKGRQQARDDEDGQQDDQRGGEAGRRHADEALRFAARREDDRRRVVLGLFQRERQVARRHHLERTPIPSSSSPPVVEGRVKVNKNSPG